MVFRVVTVHESPVFASIPAECVWFVTLDHDFIGGETIVPVVGRHLERLIWATIGADRYIGIVTLLRWRSAADVTPMVVRPQC